ncbi:MAG TPA: ATP-binding protein [Aliidongia sp.]|uniref:ATP-binding protein n=1 Tax=Aliidongia sp. TaxID=1914230 RepID=UPI002DDD7AD9|nr:ATP-binding protein [Aliidongia sp.]HEV2673138.1 ATP-binding protein [Aliidongia sp.]
MPTDLEVSFPATTSGMVAALETIEHSGLAWNLGPDQIGRLRIIVEELFSNTIKYGYGRECDYPVRLRLEMAPVLTLTYEDDAAPFDPTLWKPAEAMETPDQRPEGQAGIKMVLGLSVTAIYRPRAGGNCLVITLASPSL